MVLFQVHLNKKKLIIIFQYLIIIFMPFWKDFPHPNFIKVYMGKKAGMYMCIYWIKLSYHKHVNFICLVLIKTYLKIILPFVTSFDSNIKCFFCNNGMQKLKKLMIYLEVWAVWGVPLGGLFHQTVHPSAGPRSPHSCPWAGGSCPTIQLLGSPPLSKDKTGTRFRY